jgi:hypothetical protein
MADDLTGQRFGRLTVAGPDTSIGLVTPGGWWRCVCACGQEMIVPADGLRSGRVNSCGRPPAGTGAAFAAELAAQRPLPRL